MNKHSTRWLFAVSAVAASLSLGGCASNPSHRPAGLAEKIEIARTRADHEALGAAYEQQAGASRTAAQQSEAFARTYQGTRSYRGTELYEHYSNLARQYRQAAEENAALANLHRQLAAEAGN